jgi:hypothetical protein
MFGKCSLHLLGTRVSWVWKEMFLIQRRRASSSETSVSNAWPYILEDSNLRSHRI